MSMGIANVIIKKLHTDAQIPTRGSDYAAGYDLYAYIDNDCKEINILPHQTIKVGTGLSFELPESTFGAIFARSGLSTKQGLRPANCTGVCDADYRGEYIVALHNDTDQVQTVKHGDRIAQLILMPYYQMIMLEREQLSETARGDGGFASTGR